MLVLGDWGRRGNEEQQLVASGMDRVADRLAAQAIWTTGDNFYDDGVNGLDDSHWLESFEDVYGGDALQVPWYACLGNHDHRGCVDSQIAYANRDDRWNLPARHYSHRLRCADGSSALVVVLDTTPFIQRYQIDGFERNPRIDSYDNLSQLDWLRRTLQEPATWKVVIGHHPISSGSPYHGGAVELQQRVRPLLVDAGVVLYICGHEHDLQHMADPDGLHHLLSGAGAEVRPTGSLPTTRAAFSALGFASLGFTRQAIALRIHDAGGGTLHEDRITETSALIRPRSRWGHRRLRQPS